MQRILGSWVFFVLVGIVAACNLDARSHGPFAEEHAAAAAPETADKAAALRAEVLEHGDAAVLRGPSGKEVPPYADLYRVDATGRQLPGRLQGEAEELSSRVDDRGGVYPIVGNPLWTEQPLTTTTILKKSDRFGHSVAVSRGTAIVGAHGTASYQGAAYVFVRSGSSWTEQQKLAGSVSPQSFNFGFSVALSGNTAVVGAHGTNKNQGEAHVFVLSGSSWIEQRTLTASDAQIGDEFGVSVALSGSTAIVGARNKASGQALGQGAAYVFVRSGSSWDEQKLPASDGVADDKFGSSVALDGDTAIVGAAGKASGQGAAYVFVRSGSSFAYQQTLTAMGGAPSDQFGFSVALSGDTAIVGAPANTSSPGAAYVFVREGTSWNQKQPLTASDGVANDQFGTSVALSGSTAVVGAPVSVNRQGAAYVFVREGTSWNQKQKLTASNAKNNDDFGVSVAVSGDTAVVGAQGRTSFTGTAIVFVNPANPCSAAAECQSTFCVNGFCCNAECGGGDPNGCHVCSKAQGASDDGICTALPNNTGCDDHDPDTGDDVCTSGSCAGVNNCLNVTCPPPGVCRKTGSCIPPGGTCSYPREDDGTKCDDHDPDTGDDVCTSGSCAGVNNCLNVTCPPPGVCRKAGSCIPPGGTCSYPLEDDGTKCDDHDPDTGNDVCTSGSCAGVNNCLNATCPPPSVCRKAGSCIPPGGTCSYPPVDDGTECDDGDLFTMDDVCRNGECVGVNPCSEVDCQKPGPCQQPGKCNPFSSPYCSYPPVEDGTKCDDQNACTENDICQTGECKGIKNPCKAPDQGQPDGHCNPTTGACVFPVKPCDPLNSTCPPPVVSVKLTSCQSDDDCKDQEGHGHCSKEHVCCDTACGDLCRSCLVLGSEGVCTEEQYMDLKQDCGLYASCEKTCYGGKCVEYTGKRQCAQTECTDTSHGIHDAYCYATEKECPSERAPFDCGRYACDPVQGACLQRCDTVKDCAPPFVCDLKNRCVDAPDVAVGTDRTCAYAPAWPAGDGVRGALAAVTLAALSIARRRRRRTWGAWMILVPLVIGAACDPDAPSRRPPSERPTATAAPAATDKAVDPIEVDPLWIKQPELTASNAAQGKGHVFILALSDGEACSKAVECLSGYCVDGVCCGDACGGDSANDCQVCSKARGASTDGVCTVLTGTHCDGVSKCQNVMCPPPDPCHKPGKCNPLNGACSYAPSADRTLCDDGNACTRGDTCQMGECRGIKETCTAPDMCHKDGECEPTTGECSYPIKLCTLLPADAGPPPVVSGKLKNCASDDDCTDQQGQGHCSEEHVCCNETCGEPCKSCRIRDSEGICTSELHMDLKHDCGPKGYCLKTCEDGACVEYKGKRLCAPLECTDTTHVADEAYCEGEVTECPFEQRTLFPCDPNACDEIQGACLKECATVKDCAPPLVCDPDGECVQAPPRAVGADSACAFEPASPAGSGARGALAALALAALLVARRRRTARRSAMGSAP
jgi:hypothetical protein